MLYHINNWCPSPGMSTSGFSIELFPLFKDEFKESKLNQQQVDKAIDTMEKTWLECHGYDPELYEKTIRVSVGEWGLEHISVPGNACGLDVGNGFGSPKDGMVLTPHNVDSLIQASLIVTVFLWFADFLVLNIKSKQYNK